MPKGPILGPSARRPRGGTLEPREPLSPKHIQARVRAGASAELVASETGWPLDRVVRYAGPPLAERAYVAQRAAAVEIRRDAAGGSTSLSDSVDAALDGMGLYPDQVQWDAWRRTDGKWVVSVAHPGLPEGVVATWTYDHAGRNLHPLDEVARRLMETGFTSIEDFLGIEPEPEPDLQPEPRHEMDQRPRLVAVET
ncbi:MAG: septation protein SepH, partial [Actinomycetales bacterium]